MRLLYTAATSALLLAFALGTPQRVSAQNAENLAAIEQAEAQAERALDRGGSGGDERGEHDYRDGDGHGTSAPHGRRRERDAGASRMRAGTAPVSQTTGRAAARRRYPGPL